ncbi:hypothetical protein CROQUDRAFT_104932 [Cronartium quercuum f. sp. fusiforme G11]|uniref:Photosystem I assembly protein Ycf3 n=1 Tax=Cronartium quercuum f. sp. fusiforme G11 TaxID=708437 RepID=A0A9P6NM65_9BASI|nr:hypothetical protein CROQUDRAFT_104932 [Cronartium quercuum f. sp. fusiforme G11]
MSLIKFNLLWIRALCQFDEEEDIESAICTFQTIAKSSSKIAFNLGMLYNIQQHRSPEALNWLRTATKLDPFHAVAHFQTGVLLFNLEEFDSALTSFSQALLLLGNKSQLDYNKLGLKFNLNSYQIRFNSAIWSI